MSDKEKGWEDFGVILSFLNMWCGWNWIEQTNKPRVWKNENRLKI